MRAQRVKLCGSGRQQGKQTQHNKSYMARLGHFNYYPINEDITALEQDAVS